MVFSLPPSISLSSPHSLSLTHAHTHAQCLFLFILGCFLFQIHMKKISWLNVPEGTGKSDFYCHKDTILIKKREISVTVNISITILVQRTCQTPWHWHFLSMSHCLMEIIQTENCCWVLSMPVLVNQTWPEFKVTLTAASEMWNWKDLIYYFLPDQVSVSLLHNSWDQLIFHWPVLLSWQWLDAAVGMLREDLYWETTLKLNVWLLHGLWAKEIAFSLACVVLLAVTDASEGTLERSVLRDLSLIVYSLSQSDWFFTCLICCCRPLRSQRSVLRDLSLIVSDVT